MQVKVQLNELQRLQANIDEYQTNVININDEIDALDLKIKVIDDSVTVLDEQLKTMQAKYATIVKKAYLRNRNSMSNLAFIFSSKSFTQAFHRIEAIKRISKWQKAKSDEIKQKNYLMTSAGNLTHLKNPVRNFCKNLNKNSKHLRLNEISANP